MARPGGARRRPAAASGPPPLVWPRTGIGAGPSESSTASGVADVGLPAVERGVVGVAVAPLVPGHDPPAGRRPAAGRSTSKVPAKSNPPWASRSGGAASSPHSHTLRRRPWLSSSRWRSGRRAPAKTWSTSAGGGSEANRAAPRDRVGRGHRRRLPADLDPSVKPEWTRRSPARRSAGPSRRSPPAPAGRRWPGRRRSGCTCRTRRR